MVYTDFVMSRETTDTGTTRLSRRSSTVELPIRNRRVACSSQVVGSKKIPPQKGDQKSNAAREIGKTGLRVADVGCEGMIGESLQLQFGAGLKSGSELTDPMERVGRSPATFTARYNQTADGESHNLAAGGATPSCVPNAGLADRLGSGLPNRLTGFDSQSPLQFPPPSCPTRAIPIRP